MYIYAPVVHTTYLNFKILPLVDAYRHCSIVTASCNLSCLFKYLQKDVFKYIRFKYKSDCIERISIKMKQIRKFRYLLNN